MNNGTDPISENGSSSIKLLEGNMSGTQEEVITINPNNGPELLPCLQALPNISPTISQVNGVFSTYMKYYREYLGVFHPNLKPEQIARAATNLSDFENEHGILIDDWNKILLHFFKCKPIQTDFNINHFVSGFIIEGRYWEVIYNDNCPTCSDQVPLEEPAEDFDTTAIDKLKPFLKGGNYGK